MTYAIMTTPIRIASGIDISSMRLVAEVTTQYANPNLIKYLDTSFVCHSA